jgi:DNA-binding LacI/PurR family transcriptional regulator
VVAQDGAEIGERAGDDAEGAGLDEGVAERETGGAARRRRADRRHDTLATPHRGVLRQRLLALGVLRELTRQGLKVPDDVAIVGYDDIDFTAAAVPLSSVRQPREELGRAATKLLLEELGEGERHRHRQVVFEPELVVRESR